ncbi:hypothetical protein GCM10008941_20620 [Rhizomicrobium palustre]
MGRGKNGTGAMTVACSFPDPTSSLNRVATKAPKAGLAQLGNSVVAVKTEVICAVSASLVFR